ncbi:MAG: efflux RND transporter permease subunit, partial [Verrucomicrobiota bacterium]|nr:efflux RND transporter permease subunit [Verrucomicrobiota bacterium]
MSLDDRPNEFSGGENGDGNPAASTGESRHHVVPGEKTPADELVQFSSGLSKPFIERPVMTMLLTASLIVFGILTFKQLPVNDLPAVDYPIIQVSASYPGANPETMANTVATPLEKQFTQIPGLSFSTSSSTQGSTSITLQFDLDKSVDAAA